MLSAQTVTSSAYKMKVAVTSDQATKSGLAREAFILLEADGTWTLRYVVPTTNYKHGLKSYQACLDHLKKLNW